jgi:hypothetical protein
LAQGIKQVLEWYLLTRREVGDAVKKPMRRNDVATCDEAYLVDGRLSPKQMSREEDGISTFIRDV